jgi:hypothetical protein
MDEEIIAGSTLRQMAPRGQQANVLACRIRQPKEGDMAQREQKGNQRCPYAICYTSAAYFWHLEPDLTRL